MAGRWVDVGEAAHELGISTDAVRKRIARGSLESDRPNGHVRVWLDYSGTKTGREAQGEGDEALVQSLQDQVSYLREQLDIRTEELREHRRLLAGLIERVPELEAPSPSVAKEQPEVPEPVDEQQGRGWPSEATDAPGPQEGTEREPWWRRWFGG